MVFDNIDNTHDVKLTNLFNSLRSPIDEYIGIKEFYEFFPDFKPNPDISVTTFGMMADDIQWRHNSAIVIHRHDKMAQCFVVSNKKLLHFLKTVPDVIYSRDKWVEVMSEFIRVQGKFIGEAFL